MKLRTFVTVALTSLLATSIAYADQTASTQSAAPADKTVNQQVADNQQNATAPADANAQDKANPSESNAPANNNE